MKKNCIVAWMAVGIFLLLLNGCRRAEPPQPQAEKQKLNVLATVAPITSIVENVGGDRIRLTGIVPEGINSHTFEPVPSDIKILAEADLLVANGLELEEPTLKLANAHKKDGAAILLLGDQTITAKDYVFDFSFPKHHGHPNPHLWMNPRYVMRYAELIREELTRLDPENRADYEANAAAFVKKLESLDQAIEEAARTVPERNRRLLTYHDSWPYFARRYGFQVIGAVQPSDFSEPSPREVKRLIDQIRKEKVPAVFGSEVFPSPVLEQIAKEARTRYIDELSDDELPGSPGQPEHSYIGMMIENLTVMFEALGGSAEALRKIDPSAVAGSHANYRRQ
jgi:ABC-type Zn uptake system ZnuABC Zn-binding protein ZnuA